MSGYIFPHWFIVQKAEITQGKHRRRGLVFRDKIESNGKFKDANGRANLSVVPVRFVRACIKGHVGDIDWRGFVHRFAKVCLMDLWLEQRGTTGDLSELWVICECGDKRCLLEAAETDTHPLGNCNGSRPWFDDRDPNSCNEFNRLLQRNASNAYFARLLPVISIPDSVAKCIDGYTTQEWLEFCKTGLDYIIELNRRGLFFVEHFTALILRKMLTPYDTGFVNLQSPAGLGIAAVVFNYNGEVYPSDEARMKAEMGDKVFRMGHLLVNSYEEMMLSPAFLSIIEDTVAETVPMCEECAFLPYCGSDPDYHYATQGDFVGHKAISGFCRNMGVFPPRYSENGRRCRRSQHS